MLKRTHPDGATDGVPDAKRRNKDEARDAGGRRWVHTVCGSAAFASLRSAGHVAPLLRGVLEGCRERTVAEAALALVDAGCDGGGGGGGGGSEASAATASASPHHTPLLACVAPAVPRGLVACLGRGPIPPLLEEVRGGAAAAAAAEALPAFLLRSDASEAPAVDGRGGSAPSVAAAAAAEGEGAGEDEDEEGVTTAAAAETVVTPQDVVAYVYRSLSAVARAADGGRPLHRTLRSLREKLRRFDDLFALHAHHRAAAAADAASSSAAAAGCWVSVAAQVRGAPTANPFARLWAGYLEAAAAAGGGGSASSFSADTVSVVLTLFGPELLPPVDGDTKASAGDDASCFSLVLLKVLADAVATAARPAARRASPKSLVDECVAFAAAALAGCRGAPGRGAAACRLLATLTTPDAAAAATCLVRRSVARGGAQDAAPPGEACLFYLLAVSHPETVQRGVGQRHADGGAEDAVSEAAAATHVLSASAHRPRRRRGEGRRHAFPAALLSHGEFAAAAAAGQAAAREAFGGGGRGGDGRPAEERIAALLKPCGDVGAWLSAELHAIERGEDSDDDDDDDDDAAASAAAAASSREAVVTRERRARARPEEAAARRSSAFARWLRLRGWCAAHPVASALHLPRLVAAAASAAARRAARPRQHRAAVRLFLLAADVAPAMDAATVLVPLAEGVLVPHVRAVCARARGEGAVRLALTEEAAYAAQLSKEKVLVGLAREEVAQGRREDGACAAMLAVVGQAIVACDKQGGGGDGAVAAAAATLRAAVLEAAELPEARAARLPCSVATAKALLASAEPAATATAPLRSTVLRTVLHALAADQQGRGCVLRDVGGGVGAAVRHRSLLFSTASAEAFSRETVGQVLGLARRVVHACGGAGGRGTSDDAGFLRAVLGEQKGGGKAAALAAYVGSLSVLRHDAQCFPLQPQAPVACRLFVVLVVFLVKAMLNAPAAAADVPAEARTLMKVLAAETRVEEDRGEARRGGGAEREERRPEVLSALGQMRVFLAMHLHLIDGIAE